jgi:hypothetical protein
MKKGSILGLIVESWEQVTQEFLLEKYQEITREKLSLSKKWAGYWLDKIKDAQKNIEIVNYTKVTFSISGFK